MRAADHDKRLRGEIGALRFDPLGYVMFAFPWGVPGTALADEDGPEDCNEMVFPYNYKDSHDLSKIDACRQRGFGLVGVLLRRRLFLPTTTESNPSVYQTRPCSRRTC